MKIPLITFSFLVIVCSCKSHPTNQVPFSDTAYIRQRALSMTNALLTQNIDTFLFYQHPAFIAMLGDMNNAKLMIRKQWELRKDDSTEFKTIDVGLPTQIIEDNGLLECLLPQTFKINAKNKVALVASTLIGISPDKGKTWYFIDAAKKNLAKVKQAFPFISKKLDFPILPDAKLIEN